MSVRLMIVEDQPQILRNQLKLLSAFESLEITATAPSGESALQILEALNPRPQVLLQDLGLPGIDGIEVTRQVKARWPEIEVLVFTIFDEEPRVLEAIQAGAAGYLLKGAGADRIVDAIHEVHSGGSVIQPNLARLLLRRFQLTPAGRQVGGSQAQEDDGRPKLSAREDETLQLIAKGLSNNEAAEIMGVSPATVRTHLEHIYAKLEVTNRVEAVTEGIRKGIIDL